MSGVHKTKSKNETEALLLSPVIKTADLLYALSDLSPGCLVLCAVSYRNDKTYFTALGDSKVLFHLLLVVESQDAGG